MSYWVMSNTGTPYERLVVKIGTGFLFDYDENGKGYIFRGDQLDAITEEVSEISREREVMVVSSGAIAMAAHKLGLSEIPSDPYKRAQLAGIGQPGLFIEYQNRLEKLGRRAAQCLITREDIDDRKRRRNLRKNQEGYFGDGVITVYNENDFTSVEEITFGDNDILAALLTETMSSDLLVMLSHPVKDLGRGGGKSKEEARIILDRQQIDMKIINDRYEFDSSAGLYKPKIRGLFQQNTM